MPAQGYRVCMVIGINGSLNGEWNYADKVKSDWLIQSTDF